MLIAHRIALDPNHVQATYFARAAGTARFAWNWVLGEWQRQHQARRADPSLPASSEARLRRQLNGIKREQFPWMYDVTKCAAQEAIIDLGVAFDSFFAKCGRYSRFKKEGGRKSFCAANEAGAFRVDGRRIRLPVVGWVRMREAVRFSGPLKRVSVSRKARRWYASVLIDTDDVQPVEQPRDKVGVDLGVTTLATLSDGATIPGPKAHKRLLQRLRRHHRALSRNWNGSANRRKAKARLAHLHARIASIRCDATHKATTMPVRTYRRIGIEDLHVQGMAGNRQLARSIMDGGSFEFRRQLTYKATGYGATLVVADRWFPSSKTCFCSGSVNAGLALSQRTFTCGSWNYEAGRDHNAARNLEHLAASSAVSACGEERSAAQRKPRVKRASGKQEPNSVAAAQLW
ncbi:MAG: transposase [Rhodospirillales bacterium]|nr:transposase [Rhodospirillales bacterium]